MSFGLQNVYYQRFGDWQFVVTFSRRSFLVVDRTRTVAKCTKIEMVGQRLQKCIFFIVFTLKIWKIVTFLWVTVVTAIVVVCVSIQFIAQYQEKTAGQDHRSHWSNHASSPDICSAHCHLNFEEKVEENACFWPNRIMSEYFVKVFFSHDSAKTVALSKKTNFTVVLRILTEVNILC